MPSVWFLQLQNQELQQHRKKIKALSLYFKTQLRYFYIKRIWLCADILAFALCVQEPSCSVRKQFFPDLLFSFLCSCASILVQQKSTAGFVSPKTFRSGYKGSFGRNFAAQHFLSFHWPNPFNKELKPANIHVKLCLKINNNLCPFYQTENNLYWLFCL